MNLDLTPFYAEALSLQRHIYNDIDKIYNKKIEDYYILSKESEYYNSRIMKENPLIREIYFKKCLGIISYFDKYQNSETLDDLYNLFRKGYHKTYLFFKNKKEVDMIEYAKYIRPHISKMDDDTTNGNFTAALFFAINIGTPKNADGILDLYIKRSELFYSGKGIISLRKMSTETSKKVETLYREIPTNVLDNVLLSNGKFIYYDFLYDLEELSHLSIFHDVEFTKNDIKEIILAYIYGKKSNNEIDLNTFMIPALHIKGMCKAYKQAKDEYFKNNNETMHLEIERLKKELSKTEIKLIAEQRKNEFFETQEKLTNQNLISENDQLKSEIKKLHDQIDKMQSDKKEVVALRSFVFHQEADIDFNNEDEINVNIEELNGINGIILGGHPIWQTKLKSKLSNWRFIDINVSAIDTDIIINADVIIINTNYISHRLYYKVIDIIRNEEIPLGYVSTTNIDRAIKEIYYTIYKNE